MLDIEWRYIQPKSLKVGMDVVDATRGLVKVVRTEARRMPPTRDGRRGRLVYDIKMKNKDGSTFTHYAVPTTERFRVELRSLR